MHGFVVDENGEKMSKSLGNVVDPKIVVDGGKVSQHVHAQLHMNHIDAKVVHVVVEQEDRSCIQR